MSSSIQQYDPATVAGAVPPGAWIKAAASNANGGACVELAANPEGGAFLRDSKQPEIAMSYTGPEIAAFVDAAKNGEFDHLL
jgi:hypothetical protein